MPRALIAFVALFAASPATAGQNPTSTRQQVSALHVTDVAPAPAEATAPEVQPEGNFILEHLAALRRALEVTRTPALPRQLEITSRGLKPPTPGTPELPERAVGAKLHLFDRHLSMGTEVSRAPTDSTVRAGFNWGLAFQRDTSSGLRLGLSTEGSVQSTNPDLAQTVKGSIGLPIGPDSLPWSTEIRVVPRLSYQASEGAWRPGMNPEIVGSTRILDRQTDRADATLGLKLGYDITNGQHPAFTANVQLKIVPYF